MAEGDGGQVAWLEELVEQVRLLHDSAIKTSGGVFGEHTSSLYGACARPFQTAFGEPIYSTAYERAGALLHAIVCDHAFADGNKRTSTVVGPRDPGRPRRARPRTPAESAASQLARRNSVRSSLN